MGEQLPSEIDDPRGWLPFKGERNDPSGLTWKIVFFLIDSFLALVNCFKIFGFGPAIVLQNEKSGDHFLFVFVIGMFFLRGDKLVIHWLHEVAGIIVSFAFFNQFPELFAVDCFGVFFEGFDQGDEPFAHLLPKIINIQFWINWWSSERDLWYNKLFISCDYIKSILPNINNKNPTERSCARTFKNLRKHFFLKSGRDFSISLHYTKTSPSQLLTIRVKGYPAAKMKIVISPV